MDTQNKFTYRGINIFLALLLVSITLLIGCDTTGTYSDEPEEIEIEQGLTEEPEAVVVLVRKEAVLQENVRIIEPDEAKDIISYNPESGDIRVPAGATWVNELTQDQIIVSDISDEAPVGLLRRVVEVIDPTAYNSKTADASGNVVPPPVSGEKIIRTVIARLDELFDEVYITQTWTLSCDDDWVINFTENVRCESGEIVVNLADETLEDAENKNLTANLKSDVFIRPTIKFDIFIDDGLQQVIVDNETTIRNNITLSAEASFKEGFKKDVLKIPFKPRTILVNGIVPIVYQPIIKISVGANGELTTKIELSTESETTYKRKYTYIRGSDSIREELITETKPREYSEPVLTTKFKAKAYVVPRLEIVFYGFTGLYAEASFYLALDADPSVDPHVDPWWELYAGVKVTLGFEFTIFTEQLPSVKWDPFEYRWDLDSADLLPPAEPDQPPQPETETPPAQQTEPPPAPTPEPQPEPTQPPPPPPPEGNENIRIVYNNNFAYVMSITQGPVRVKGLEFKRIDNQGNETASFNSQVWAGYYSGYDPIQPGYCPRIALPNSPYPTECKVSVNRETEQEQFHFWRETSTSKQFHVLQNGDLLKNCEISAGSCDVYVPQP